MTIATPPITEELRAEALRNPGGWVYVVDPELDTNDGVPPAGIAGAWQVSDAGAIIGAFQANAAYQPSPTALGFPTARDRLERSLQLYRAGFLDSAALPDLLRLATLLVPSSTTRHATGADALDVFSNPGTAADGASGPIVEIVGAELCERFGGYRTLRIDRGSPATVTIEFDRL